MERSKIAERVKSLTVEHLAVDAAMVTDTASFTINLGADSLDHVELIMTFEEEFSVQIPDADAEKLLTINDVVDYIAARKPVDQLRAVGAGGVA